MRTLKSEAALWLHTPLPEVLLWALLVFGVASAGRAWLGVDWLSSRYLRIAFDIFAVTISVSIMAGSLLKRGSWRRMHLGALSAITGDQISALLVDLSHYRSLDLLLLTMAATAAFVGAVLMVLAYRTRPSLTQDAVTAGG